MEQYLYLFNLLGITTLTFTILGAMFGLALESWKEFWWFSLGGVYLGLVGMAIGFLGETVFK